MYFWECFDSEYDRKNGTISKVLKSGKKSTSSQSKLSFKIIYHQCFCANREYHKTIEINIETNKIERWTRQTAFWAEHFGMFLMVVASLELHWQTS